MEDNKYSSLNSKQTVAEIDPFTIERYAQFSRHFKPGTRTVLDIGCANGRGGAVLKEKCPDISLHGLDVVAERIAQIEKLKLYDKLYVASATQIPVEDNVFDVVVAGEFIEHIAPDDVDNVLKELYRVLSRGGTLFLTTPNPDAFLIKLGRDSVMKDPAHLSLMKAVDLKNRLNSLGFRNIVIKGSGKASRFLGEKFPLFSVYGSYFISGEK